MSTENTILDTTNEYLLKAYTRTVDTPAIANELNTQYTFSLEYTEADYIPMVLGTYTLENGDTYRLHGWIEDIYGIPEALLYVYKDEIVINIYNYDALGLGANAAGNAVTTTYHVLINSAAELP